MAITEKVAPTYFSFLASGIALFVVGYIWYAGAENPRKYHSSMRVSNHNRYDGNLTCYDCHVPESTKLGFKTIMDCSSCHGELNTPPTQEGLDYIRTKYFYLPNVEERLQHHLALHAAAKTEDCWSCHVEHRPYADIRTPDGFRRWADEVTLAASEGREQVWVSFREEQNQAATTAE